MDSSNPWNSEYKSLQGNIGLGRAIAYFTSKGITTMIPLNDTQKFDLVVEIDGILKRVSVKTTKGKNKNGKNFVVQLKNSGGSSGKSKIRKFDNTSCELLFISTIDNDNYLIPSKKISNKSALVLTEELDMYKVSY